MNTLVVLLMATAAPAADPQPQPLPIGPPNPPQVVIVKESDWSEPPAQQRPRLFGKLRSYVHSKWSQLTDRGSDTTTVTVPNEVVKPVNTNNGLVPVRMLPRSTQSVITDSSAEPPLADPVPSK